MQNDIVLSLIIKVHVHREVKRFLVAIALTFHPKPLACERSLIKMIAIKLKLVFPNCG